MLSNQYRTHHCGALRVTNAESSVVLSGWINNKRDHGGLLFVDLRDRYGLTQIVIDPTSPAFEVLNKARNESVVTVKGNVVKRSPETINNNLLTGEIEVVAKSAEVLSYAPDLPLQVNSDSDFPEETRLTYRFLDLRRKAVQDKILKRFAIIKFIREKMHNLGFTEFQTPILTASSPEGARDFVVPSRLHPGKFYALPQAPQIFKQLIMVSGFDKYFQIAPCFRDEDARRDRSPGEFYQLDIEMSFVTQDEIFAMTERVVHDTFREFIEPTDSLTPYPFQRISYDESMEWYGNDKPDLRNPIQMATVTDIFSSDECSFDIFKKLIQDKKAIVRAIPAPQANKQPRSWFDKMNEWGKSQLGLGGLGYIQFEEVDGKLVGKGPVAKFLSESLLQTLASRLGVVAGDSVFFICNTKKLAIPHSSETRTKIGQELGLINESHYHMCWVVDFPMYEWSDEEKKYDFSHNPFSMPQGGIDVLNNKDPLAIKAYQYDLVCNGIELSSGAIRNHKPEIMYKAFEIAGYDKNFVDEKFSGMINAFKYGAPPHGGIAPGIDRMVMLICKEENIREVLLFPMNQKGEDLMLKAPSSLSEKQLKDVHIKLNLPNTIK